MAFGHHGLGYDCSVSLRSSAMLRTTGRRSTGRRLLPYCFCSSGRNCAIRSERGKTPGLHEILASRKPRACCTQLTLVGGQVWGPCFQPQKGSKTTWFEKKLDYDSSTHAGLCSSINCVKAQEALITNEQTRLQRNSVLLL